MVARIGSKCAIFTFRNAMNDRVCGKVGSIVVTGAGGLLGSNLLLCASEQKRPVMALTHTRDVHLPSGEVHRVDLVEEKSTLALMEKLEPAAIVHCAAATDVDWCEDHPDEAAKINVSVPGSLAVFAFQRKLPFVHISTDSIFDGNRSCYSETDEPNPVNVYARTKLAAEREVLRRNPGALVARVTMYGWTARRKLTLAELVFDSLTAERAVPGFTDVYFCPILVNDLGELILALLDRGEHGIFHMVGSERISKYEFARSVARVFDLPMNRVLPARVGASGLKATRPLDTSLSIEKIARVLGRTTPDVESGLRRFRQLHETGYRQKLNTLMGGETI
jgi:dTDP-4-dehydrorhamnose reductase